MVARQTERPRVTYAGVVDINDRRRPAQGRVLLPILDASYGGKFIAETSGCVEDGGLSLMRDQRLPIEPCSGGRAAPPRAADPGSLAAFNGTPGCRPASIGCMTARRQFYRLAIGRLRLTTSITGASDINQLGSLRMECRGCATHHLIFSLIAQGVTGLRIDH